jgi:hypothetical protein
VDVEIQSRPPQYGLGRHHPKAATGHGCITVLLLTSVEIGGITAGIDAEPTASILRKLLLR